MSPFKEYSTARRKSAFVALAFASLVFLFSSPAPEKRLTVYSPGANYSLAVTEHGGRDYVGLLEILEPLGRVATRAQRQNWKIRFDNVDAQFVSGSSKGRIRGHDFDLGAPFLLQNDRGQVPIDSITTLLPQFLRTPVLFHNSARRLFIQQNGITYSAELNRSAGPKVVFNFTAPVNPTIATEPGKVTMSFLRDPVVASGPPTTSFDDKTISSTAFQEGNGGASIVVQGSAPLLASFSNNGRTITVAPVAPTVAVQPAAAQQPAAPPGTPAPTTPAANPVVSTPSMPRFQVVIDPSHGGEERGAALSDTLLEKDVTLAFARRIRVGLESHGIATLMLRDGDTSLTPDQRASVANAAHASLYISLHAANDGTGTRVYTAVLTTGADNRGPFLSWDTAQAASLSASQLWASSIGNAAGKVAPVRILGAPLPPLNNVTIPAVAIEIAPRQPGNVADLNSPDYQQLLANSVTAGILSARDNLGGTQ